VWGRVLAPHIARTRIHGCRRVAFSRALCGMSRVRRSGRPTASARTVGMGQHEVQGPIAHLTMLALNNWMTKSNELVCDEGQGARLR